MQDKDARAAVTQLRGRVSRLEAAARAREQADALKPPVTASGPQPWRHRTVPERLSGLELALRFCRDGKDSLAARLKPVPEEHVDGLEVSCRCGATVQVGSCVRQCPGEGCDRWYAGDESGVWWVPLPDQEPDDWPRRAAA